MTPEALLSDEQAHPLALLRLLLRRYGKDLLDDPWSPDVLLRTLSMDFPDATVPEINLHKTMAALAVATTDEFWEHWEHFHFLAQALSNNIPDHKVHHELPISQMMVAVDIANSIRKDLKSLSYVPKFSEELARYVAAQALQDGVWYLPTPLDFAGKFSAGRKYHCLDCGNKSEVLFDDGLCDICTDRFNVSSLSGWQPDMSLVDRGWGRNLRFFEDNPTDKVEARFVRALKGDLTLQETQTDVCTAKLLLAVQFMGKRREQLKAQS